MVDASLNQENKELKEALQIFSRERLTSKQKRILQFIATNNKTRLLPVTPLALELFQALHCSETTVWNNLRQLKKIGIISYGDQRNKGIPVVITTLGKIIINGLEE